MKTVFPLLTAFALVVSSSHAVLVASFDAGNGTLASATFAGPAGAPDSLGNLWTSAPGPSGGPFTDPSGISVTFSNGTAYISTASAGFTSVTNDFVYDGTGGTAGVQTANFSIAGLSDGLTYDIYFIAPNGTQFGAANQYGGRYRYGATSATATGATNADTSWVEGQNFAVLRGVTSASGVIAGTYEEFEGSLNPVNFGIAGVQVVTVPEPSTLTLSALAGLALLRRSRRG